jgi:hypothetical protein
MVLTTLRISKEMIRDITNPDIVKDLMTQLMVKSYQCAEKAFNGVCKRHKIKKVCDLFYGRPGTHTISFGGSIGNSFSTSVEYKLMIVR